MCFLLWFQEINNTKIYYVTNDLPPKNWLCQYILNYYYNMNVCTKCHHIDKYRTYCEDIVIHETNNNVSVSDAWIDRCFTRCSKGNILFLIFFTIPFSKLLMPYIDMWWQLEGREGRLLKHATFLSQVKRLRSSCKESSLI